MATLHTMNRRRKRAERLAAKEPTVRVHDIVHVSFNVAAAPKEWLAQTGLFLKPPG